LQVVPDVHRTSLCWNTRVVIGSNNVGEGEVITVVRLVNVHDYPESSQPVADWCVYELTRIHRKLMVKGMPSIRGRGNQDFRYEYVRGHL
jgi:hypothetical protein